MERDIILRAATVADAAILGEMNRQLILDEVSQNTMNLSQLEQRMASWLSSNYQAVIVARGGEIIGYLLYRHHVEEYHPYQNSIHVRQFFISPSYRRRGIGQIAFEQIIKEFFPEDHAVMLDVLETNPEGKAFWLKLGFDVYYVTMRRD
jgi:ribosomal protein S18 acetylase RimI-like enzyme